MQVDLEAPDELFDKYSKMAPVFLVQQIPDGNIFETMKVYKEKTGIRNSQRKQKLLDVMKAKKILLYTTVICWYLEHGLRFTAVNQSAEYGQRKPFSRFQEVANTRREVDKNCLKNSWAALQN